MTDKVKKLYRLTTITPDGVVTHQVQSKAFSLEQLQKAVGGLIQTVGFFHTFEGKKCEAYVNEEGYIHGLSLNYYATRLWKDQYAYADILAGNIAIKTRVLPGEGH